MRRLIASELLKFRTVRSLPALPAAALALVLLAAWHWLKQAGGANVPALGSAPHTWQLLGFAGLGVLPLLLTGLLLVTVEFRHGGATPTFLAEPRRQRVLLAKAVTAAVLGATWAVLATGAVLALALPWASSRGVDLTAVIDGRMLRHTVAAVLVVAAFAVLGVGIGALLRNQALAVGIAVVWVVQLENEIAGRLGELGRWLPVQAGLAVGGRGFVAEPLPAVTAAAALAAWVALLLAAAVWTVRRRDV